ncbi:hypothetical protein [Bythopirellula polymerisocia]|uniref:Uncharacterized protein n=1 Tax=Bythopirellula polymerisocia TaxID=2528003 RepID=A0A5C6D2P1_9BACT|nr:hypothetical protein [Bythopirellula polymerisocia]TWU30051.1 hypothetical protein Pla144_08370 [Bythopirellula polymerisocia]
MCAVCGRGVSQKLRWCLLGLIALAVLARYFSGSSLYAQEAVEGRYDTLPAKLSAREASRIYPAVNQGLRKSAGFGADQQAVDDYLAKYYLPKMTSDLPEDLAELAKNREKFFKNFIGMASNSNSKQHLVDLGFKFSRYAARGNMHPAVRYNAVLMLGDLDQQPPTNTTPPVPLATATVELLELVEQAEFNDVPVPESVKLGALIGLERHARYGIDPKQKDRLTKAMLAILANREPPEDVEKDVHGWVLTLAAQVLANQYAQDPTQEVQDALTSLISDEEMGLDDRCKVAALLKRVDYSKAAGVDSAATVPALGQLSLDVVSSGAKKARKYQKELLGGGGFAQPGGFGGGYGGGGRGGYGGEGGYGGGGGYGGEFGGGRGGFGGGTLEDTGPKFERRQLMARLVDIRSGSGSIYKGLQDAEKVQMESLIDEMKPTFAVFEDKDAVEVKVTQAVIDLETRLKTLLATWKLPANDEPAKEASDDDFAG